MHAVNAGAVGEIWATIGRSVGRPSAVLMVTAHWETNLPTLSGNPNPPTIYDFGGFPEPLYQIRYPAVGAPAVAAQAAALLDAAGIAATIDDARGMDHGTWVPLLKLFPDADIPVVQLSVQPARNPEHHLAVGRALRPLRDGGVLIVGSGHLTHNLRDWMQSRDEQSPLPYALAFQRWVNAQLGSGDVAALSRYRETSADGLRAHPTPEHLLPLFVALGAANDDAIAERLFDGFEGAALALDAYRFQ